MNKEDSLSPDCAKRNTGRTGDDENGKGTCEMQVPFFWRRHPESNWGMKVLQTSALPLGYGAGTGYVREKNTDTPQSCP